MPSRSAFANRAEIASAATTRALSDVVAQRPVTLPTNVRYWRKADMARDRGLVLSPDCAFELRLSDAHYLVSGGVPPGAVPQGINNSSSRDE
jgi:hypothetical protein